MAKTFKPSPFENIIKKYTLCGLCDGKIIDSSFLQCGCSVILCIYCNEIHSCKFHQQAVIFDSSKENKSISFIQQLSALMTTYASDKDKENKGLIENSHSSSLPDLDDLMVNETANGGDLSFSQLFDDRCSRNEKPRLSLSSIKRESISPRISYTLKRKQYLSDSEDEESFNKSESILYKGQSDRSSSVKKKISKKMKISNKSQDTSIFSSIGCDSDSLNSDKQPLERKKRSRKGRHSLPAGMSSSVVNDVSTSPLHQVSSPFPESCQTVQKTNVPSEDDKTYVEHNNDAENNSSYFRETIKEEDIEKVASPVKNTSDDKLCANYIDGTFKNSSFEENADKNKVLSTCEQDDDEMVMISIIDNINQNLEEDDVKPMTAKKQRNSIKHVKKSKSIKNKTVESDEQRKQQDNDLSNCNLGDFDGFDQCDINTSTLNYMLYKLTTPCNDNDEMIFPIHYRGKTFVIHLKDKFDGEFNDNEYHYVLKPFKTSSNHSAQTDPLTMPEDKAIGITQTDSNDIAETCVGEDVKASFVQTDSYQVIDACVGHDGHKASSVQTDSSQLVDACVGREGEKASFVQTNGYQVQDACVGRKGEKDSFVQTDGYQVGDACVGPDGKISEVTQTDRYFVRDSYTSTKDFRCCAVQTNLTINSSANLWNHTDIAVQSDVHNNEVCDISSDMPYSNVNAHYPTSDTVRNNTSYELNPKVSISLAIADVKEDSDNEDEDIIEGTPIKANNLSFASLNLSALKGRNHRFDWNDSIIARDDTISCSDLTNVDKFIVQKFTKCFGMEYSEYFNNKTTHLVVSSRLSHGSHKTFKYLIAIASKACIVSIEWVKDSLLRKELLPVDDYIPINHPGPMRCRMNGNLPLTGLTICVQLLTNYPGVKAMEALCKLCGAYIVEDIKQCNSSQSWPFPRFCLFEDESQLTCQILNSCSKNHIVAINFEWVFDSVAAYCRQPILKYICSTFLLTEDIIETYKIPSDMLVDDCS